MSTNNENFRDFPEDKLSTVLIPLIYVFWSDNEKKYSWLEKSWIDKSKLYFLITVVYHPVPIVKSLESIRIQAKTLTESIKLSGFYHSLSQINFKELRSIIDELFQVCFFFFFFPFLI